MVPKWAVVVNKRLMMRCQVGICWWTVVCHDRASLDMMSESRFARFILSATFLSTSSSETVDTRWSTFSLLNGYTHCITKSLSNFCCCCYRAVDSHHHGELTVNTGHTSRAFSTSSRTRLSVVPQIGHNPESSVMTFIFFFLLYFFLRLLIISPVPPNPASWNTRIRRIAGDTSGIPWPFPRFADNRLFFGNLRRYR